MIKACNLTKEEFLKDVNDSSKIDSIKDEKKQTLVNKVLRDFLFERIYMFCYNIYKR